MVEQRRNDYGGRTHTTAHATMGYPRFTCMDLGPRARALGVEAVGQLNDYEKVQLALALADDAYRTTDPPAGVADDLEGACERLVRARGALRRREDSPGGDWHETDVDVDATS